MNMSFMLKRLASVFTLMLVAVLAGYFIDPLLGLIIFISASMFLTLLNTMQWYKQASARNKPLTIALSLFFLLVASTVIYTWLSTISSW
jgi:hypothetical protein